MADTIQVDKLIKECDALKSFWAPRATKFKEWYKMLQMVDELKQDDMESFVSNDPRTAYNLALHLLTAQSIPHKIPLNELTPEELTHAPEIENFLTRAWKDVYGKHRRKGRQSWLRELVSYIVGVGWYSVFAIATDEGCYAEIWNPAEVFPKFGEDGLESCVHIYESEPATLNKKIRERGWQFKEKVTRKDTVRDYWKYDENGRAANYIMIGRELATPSSTTELDTIPLFVSPVGGLPDMGSIMTGSTWKKEIGQALIAANEPIYKSLNKHWTFSLQLLRDTAQPRWFEKSRGANAIMKPEDVFKRGSIFRGTPEDSIEALSVPPIPVELRSDRLDMEAMLQRGGPPYSLYGNIQQAMSAYLMAQVSEAAQQTFRPYHQAIIGVLSDIDNYWLGMIRKHGVKPYNFEIPSEIPDTVEVTAAYNIKIPGDLAQRATVARMLSPTIKMSETRVMEELFPEITNPIQEQAQARKDLAMQHPVMATISLVQALRRLATECKNQNDDAGAKLYEKAAAAAESTLAPPPQTTQPPPGTAPGQEQPPGPEANLELPM